jgi:3-methyladenine DNA glycosylase AlkD
MITYEELIARLFSLQDTKYRDFHKKLLKNDRIQLIGVRTPQMRKLANELKGEWQSLRAFPNDYYEVLFVKCSVAGTLPFLAYCAAAEELVPQLDNWAACDCFHNKAVAKHREEFLPFIKKWLADEREFVHRYGLVSLLHDYVTEEYLPLIFSAANACNAEQYYVTMAAAWLIAEVLVKYYGKGVAFLRGGTLPAAVHNKALQKARESFRLTAEQKEALKMMKR